MRSRTIGRWGHWCAGILLAGATIAPPAFAQSGFEPNSTLFDDAANDRQPALATDGQGNWMSVWTSNAGILSAGTDDDILFARWSGVETPSVADVTTGLVNVATGVVDNLLSVNGPEENPSLATDGNGRWICVWQSKNLALNDQNSPNDFDLHYAIYDDGVGVWQGPFLIDNFVNTAHTDDETPTIMADGTGNWFLIWSAHEADLGGTGPDADIFFLKSIDNGATWGGNSFMAVVDNAGADTTPHAATDEAGNILVVWSSTDTQLGLDAVGGDSDIAFAVSRDNGATPFSVGALSVYMSQDSGSDVTPRTATNSKGTWVVVWATETAINGNGSDSDIVAATITDNGDTVGAPVIVNSFAQVDGSSADREPRITTDGFGTWVCVWESTYNPDGVAGIDGDLYFSVSTDNGATWSDAQTVAANPASDNLLNPADGPAGIVTDRTGAWFAVWAKGLDLLGSLVSDITVAKGRFTGTLQGTIRIDGEAGDCVAIVATGIDRPVERRTVTDDNGEYTFRELPVGSYEVTFYPVGADPEASFTTIELDAETTLDAELEGRPLESGVFGRVVDGGDATVAVAAALVEARIGGSLVGRTYTCGDGRYELNNVVSTKGSTTAVIMSIEADGYNTGSSSALVEPPANGEANAAVMKSIGAPGTLAGFVGDSGDEAPLAGATIALQGRVNVTTQAQNDGNYVFDALPEGVYEARASLAGYFPDSRTVTVRSGTTSAAFLLDWDAASAHPADLNKDKRINAIDVQIVINGALGVDTQEFETDVNGDGLTNAIDVQSVINAALN